MSNVEKLGRIHALQEEERLYKLHPPVFLLEEPQVVEKPTIHENIPHLVSSHVQVGDANTGGRRDSLSVIGALPSVSSYYGAI